MATLASVTGAELPAKNAAEDSYNLLPLLSDPQQSVRTSHVHNTKTNSYAIRHNDWLLIDAKDGYISRKNPQWEKKHNYQPDDQQEVELYKLKTDLGQRHNVASQHPETVKKLKKLLKHIREQGHTSPRLD